MGSKRSEASQVMFWASFNKMLKSHYKYIIDKAGLRALALPLSTPNSNMAIHHRSSSQPDQPKMSMSLDEGKIHREFAFLGLLAFPSSPEAAAARIIHNLGYFRLYYALFLWVIIFASLAPKRHISLILFFAVSAVTCFYLLVLRLIPTASAVPYKTIDTRLVVALLQIVAAVALILTHAGIHLVVSLASGIPVVLLHAVLQVTDDYSVHEHVSATSEVVPLVQMETGDLESQT